MATNRFSNGSQTFSQSGNSISQKIIIRRMRRKDGKAKYAVSSGSITQTQYNVDTGTQTTTKREYRTITARE